MNQEVICTGFSGRGIFCSDCGKYIGSADIHVKIPDHNCFDCNSSEVDIVSKYPIMFITQTS